MYEKINIHVTGTRVVRVYENFYELFYKSQFVASFKTLQDLTYYACKEFSIHGGCDR